MTIKQVLRLGVSLACLSSPMLLWVAPPVGAQNQSDATNINATGSEIAPPFIPLPGGGTVGRVCKLITKDEWHQS